MIYRHMIAKALFIQNHKEIFDHHQNIEQYGVEEAFNLGLIDKKEIEPIYTHNDFLFKLEHVINAWVLNETEKCINIKLNTFEDETWTLEYSDELWDKLKKYLT